VQTCILTHKTKRRCGQSRAQLRRNAVETVNARDLHAFLESGRRFSDWIAGRIASFGFVENQDFIRFTNSRSGQNGGQNATEYALTIDMAKELAMVERDIREIIAQSPKTGLLTFKETTFTATNRDTYPRFDMDRDGFSLLAMGFTGTKALR
jgi:Rha family phage regulatory protein